MNIGNKNLQKLITPSWLSALIAIVSGLALSVGIVAAYHFTNSGFQQQLLALQQTSKQPVRLTQPGELAPAGNNSLQSNVPLLVLYAFVGLAIYYIAISAVNAAQSISELRREMSYVNARPHEMMRSFGERLGLRLLSLVVWLGFTELFVRRIVPYALTASHASAADVLSLDGGLYVILACVLIAGSVQLHVIFMRLVVGRLRVFNG